MLRKMAHFLQILYICLSWGKLEQGPRIIGEEPCPGNLQNLSGLPDPKVT